MTLTFPAAAPPASRAARTATTALRHFKLYVVIFPMHAARKTKRCSLGCPRRCLARRQDGVASPGSDATAAAAAPGCAFGQRANCSAHGRVAQLQHVLQFGV